MSVLAVVCLLAAALVWPARRWGARPLLGAAARRSASTPYSALTPNLGGSQNSAPTSNADTPTADRGRVSADDVAMSALVLALALRSGCGTTEAIRTVARASVGAVADDLAAVVAALDWGRSMSDAWAYADPRWRAVSSALVIADQAGSSPSEMLLTASRSVRTQSVARRQAAASRAGVLLVVPLGLMFLPAFLLIAVVPLVFRSLTGVIPH